MIVRELCISRFRLTELHYTKVVLCVHPSHANQNPDFDRTCGWRGTFGCSNPPIDDLFSFAVPCA